MPAPERPHHVRPPHGGDVGPGAADARRRRIPHARPVSRTASGVTPAEPVVGAGLAEHVYQLLKAEVINDQFEAEQRIVIETVAVRLGVSPTPVREALARLAGEQLVAFRAYVGYSALPPLSLVQLNDLFEAREAIECAGALHACERASDADLERLRAIDAHIRAGHYG